MGVKNIEHRNPSIKTEREKEENKSNEREIISKSSSDKDNPMKLNKKEYEGETNLQWKSTPFQEKPLKHSWSEDAITPVGKVAYRLYYDSELKETFLDDLREGIKYNISNGAKAKGYVLAFKLNTRLVRNKKKRLEESDENYLPF